MPGKDFQSLLLLLTQIARDLVDNAQRSERISIRSDERGAGVKADLRLRNNHRVLSEPGIQQRISDDEQVGLQNGMGAKGDVTRGFRHRRTHLRLEPLPLLVNEGNHRDGRFADARRELGQVIENRLRQRVQQVILPQDFKPFSLAGWEGSTCRVHDLAERDGKWLEAKINVSFVSCLWWLQPAMVGPWTLPGFSGTRGTLFA